MSRRRGAPGPIVVMKFGGTSVADPDKIQRAADRAIALRRRGRSVVVVVSAPGDMTDDLIGLARRITPRPDSRELDMLMATGEQVGISLFAIACRARRVPAVSLTGPAYTVYGSPAIALYKIWCSIPAGRGAVNPGGPGGRARRAGAGPGASGSRSRAGCSAPRPR